MKSNPNYNDKKKVIVEQVKREIEKKTEKMVDLAYKTGNLVNPIDIINKKDDDKQQQNSQVSEQLLRNIMSSGAREFNQKIGRPMTYGEMREMWG
jgi:hypothetical protein